MQPAHCCVRMQAQPLDTSAAVARLWRDVQDDIERHDAELPTHTSPAEPQAPTVCALDWATQVKIPVRRGVNPEWLEAALLELQREEREARRGPGRGLHFSSSKVVVRRLDACLFALCLHSSNTHPVSSAHACN